MSEKRTRRDVQADATREHIVAVAERMFLSGGYVATSITAIANEAGVAVQTVYNAVGAKASLLSAVLDRVAAGPDSPRPVAEFMQERTAHAPDAAAVVTLLADWFVEVHERAAAVFALIAQAATVDADAAQVQQRRAEQRLANYALAASALRERGALAGLSDAQAATTIWALGHPQVYRSLVLDGDWSVAEYRAWLELALRGALGLEIVEAL